VLDLTTDRDNYKAAYYEVCEARDDLRRELQLLNAAPTTTSPSEQLAAVQQELVEVRQSMSVNFGELSNALKSYLGTGEPTQASNVVSSRMSAPMQEFTDHIVYTPQAPTVQGLRSTEPENFDASAIFTPKPREEVTIAAPIAAELTAYIPTPGQPETDEVLESNSLFELPVPSGLQARVGNGPIKLPSQVIGDQQAAQLSAEGFKVPR
jgi:hypothetical protein